MGKYCILLCCLIVSPSAEAQDIILSGVYDLDEKHTYEIVFESVSDGQFVFTAGIAEKDTENGNELEVLWVAKWDSDGKNISSAILGTDNFYPNAIFFNSENELVISLQGRSGKSAIVLYDKALDYLKGETFNFYSWDLVENKGRDGYVSSFGNEIYFISKDLEHESNIKFSGCGYDIAQIFSHKDYIVALAQNFAGCNSSANDLLPDATQGQRDVVLIKLDYDGNVIWAKNFGSSKDDSVFRLPRGNFESPRKDRLIVDNQDNIYFSASAGEEDKDFTPDDSEVERPQVLFKMSKDGNVIWKTFIHTRISNFVYALKLINADLFLSSESSGGFSHNGIGCNSCNLKYSNIRQISTENGNILREYLLDGSDDDFVSTFSLVQDKLVLFGITTSSDDNESPFFTSSESDYQDMYTAYLTIGESSAVKDYPIKSINLFPNPALSQIYIGNGLPVKYVIFSTDGKKVLSGLGHEVDVSDLHPGTYYIKSENYHTEKFIKI